MNLSVSDVTSLTRSLLIILALSLSFAAGHARAQCGTLSSPSTTWSDASGSWAVAGNWTSGTPNVSTNACILDNTSTVTLDTSGNANGIELASGNSLNINSAGSLSLVGASDNDGGTINNSGTLNNTASANFANYGTLINNSGAHFTNNGAIGGGADSYISNSGTFINNSGISLCSCELGGDHLANAGNFANSGTIFGDGLFLLNQGTFNNSGTINVVSDIDPSGFTNSGAFNSSGTLSLRLAWSIGNFSNTGTFDNTGTANLDITCGFGDCSIPNNSLNSGTINNSGVFNITRSSAGGDFTNSGTINNTGTLSDSVAMVINNTGTINNAGTVNNMGTINNLGTINNSGTFANSGAVTISGVLNTSASYTQTAGSTLVDGTLSATGGAIVNIQGGALGGTGTINGNVEMAGIITPGDPGVPGKLTILGNYEQTGTGILEELIGPSSHSFLDVSGDVALDSGSTLDIMLLDGYDPLGQTFEIVDYSSLAGEFANSSSFWDDGYLWDVSYGRNQLDVTAVSTPEPKSLPFLFIGLAALVLYGRRKLDNVRRLA